MLVLKPPGRGNWQKTYVTIDRSRHSPLPLEVHVGDVWVLAGRTFRVCAVYM